MTTTEAAGRRTLPAGTITRLATSVGGIAVVFVLAAVFTPAFYTAANLADVFRQIGIIGVAAVGQTFVLLVAGIDLSVGAFIGMSMVMVAQFTAGSDGALPLAILGVAGFGLVGGLLNAGLVVGRKVPPFVATFAVFILIQGLISAWTQGSPSGRIPPGLSWLGAKSIAGVPTPMIIFVVVLAVAAFVLTRTTYGRRIYATGSNPVAARMSGIPTGVIVASAYVVCALLAVLAGLMTSGYTGYVDNYLSRSLNLDSVAAAVVGGVALSGGKGGVGRTTLGVVLLAVLINFVGLLGAGNAGQLLIEGAVILGAVWLQNRSRQG